MRPSKSGTSRKRDLIVGPVLLAVLVACTPHLPRYSPATDASETGFYADSATPHLALLEYRIAQYLSFRNDRPYTTICAAAANMVPHRADSRPVALDAAMEGRLLARFPKLSPLTRCERAGVGYIDPRTGAPAAVFDVNEFACESQLRCTGYAGYLADGRHGWRYYQMAFERGAWRIRPGKVDIQLTGERR